MQKSLSFDYTPDDVTLIETLVIMLGNFPQLQSWCEYLITFVDQIKL